MDSPLSIKGSFDFPEKLANMLLLASLVVDRSSLMGLLLSLSS